MRLDRRQLLLGALASSLAGRAAQGSEPTRQETPIQQRIYVFTDPLDGLRLGPRDLAAALKGLGVAGPDLTVRPGGYVAPERAGEELPRVHDALRGEGLNLVMASTNLTSARQPTARPVLTALGRLGVRYAKTGYFHRRDPARWKEELSAVVGDLRGLTELGRAAGVQLGFHNHSGGPLGGPLWEVWEVLEPLEARWVGSYFDPAHATVEGGGVGWEAGFLRLASRIKMVAIKDFVWHKGRTGWERRWCPLGEGMVRWPEFFRLLARASFAGPVSLHVEYDAGGATPAARRENVLAALARDLKFLRARLREAFGDPGRNS